MSRVRLADAAAARSLRSLTDANGSGNVSDLLREGVRYTGSPAELSGAEYASAVSGTTVTIVESAWVDEDADGSSADIDQVADDGLALAVPPFPAEVAAQVAAAQAIRRAVRPSRRGPAARRCAGWS